MYVSLRFLLLQKRLTSIRELIKSGNTLRGKRRILNRVKAENALAGVNSMRLSNDITEKDTAATATYLG